MLSGIAKAPSYHRPRHLGDAQRNLLFMYHQGKDKTQDYAEAKVWDSKLPEQRDAFVRRRLGVMYNFGNGVPQDYVEAVAWYRKAAEQGDAGAQLFIGLMYAQGKGVPQDYVSAHMWINLASSNGGADGASTRDSVATKMPPEDVSEAQRRARVCLASDYQDCD